MDNKQNVNNNRQTDSIIRDLQNLKHVFWVNPKKEKELNQPHFTIQHIQKADEMLRRFAPYLQIAFPETKNLHGIIESPVKEIPNMKKIIESRRGMSIPGKVYLKCDHALPISGSIKARGGIYEVLKYAEMLAIKHKLISETDDYTKFLDESMQQFFSQYKIAVGSTGNLGLSIGIMGKKLGFHVTVHMSQDAKKWKKDLLKQIGAEVIQYDQDYSVAVEEGRKKAQSNPNCHFVDDENSEDLFTGYTVSALRLQEQLKKLKIKVDENHPLFVYLPCGVGGGPGGVAYGLKLLYGENVHIFFGEPQASPCMLLGMATGLHDKISVFDIGLTNQTEADGLAVGRASKFVGPLMEPILSGCYTVDDSFLFRSLKAMYEHENIFMEPSSHVSVFGPIALMNMGMDYLNENHLVDKLENATHLLWSTGGNMVPYEERKKCLNKTI